MISLFVTAAAAKPVRNTDSDADILEDANMSGYPAYGVGYGGYGYGLGRGGYVLVSPYASLRYGASSCCCWKSHWGWCCLCS